MSYPGKTPKRPGKTRERERHPGEGLGRDLSEKRETVLNPERDTERERDFVEIQERERDLVKPRERPERERKRLKKDPRNTPRERPRPQGRAQTSGRPRERPEGERGKPGKDPEANIPLLPPTFLQQVAATGDGRGKKSVRYWNSPLSSSFAKVCHGGRRSRANINTRGKRNLMTL